MSYEQFGYLEQKQAIQKERKAISIGQVFPTKKCGDVKVIGYEEVDGEEMVRVRFVESGKICLTTKHYLKIGHVSDRRLLNIMGEGHVSMSRNCGVMRLVENLNPEAPSRYHRVIVKFLNTGTLAETTLRSFKIGTVDDPYIPRVAGIGFLGKGIYKAHDITRGGNTEAYNKWSNMIRRCYSKNRSKRNASYENATVREDWFNFQNFAEWYENYPYKDTSWHLEKDIIIRGNREYSEEACCFVPPEMNMIKLHVENQGEGYMIPGVNKCTTGLGYQASLPKGIVDKYGIKTSPMFPSAEEAFHFYKKCKEENISDLLTKYRDKLDPRVIKVFESYRVEPHFLE